MARQINLLLAVLVLFTACNQTATTSKEETPEKATQENWRMVLQREDGAEIPVVFKKEKDQFVFQNGKERIKAMTKEESGKMIVKMPVYNSWFELQEKEGKLAGQWIKISGGKEYKMNVVAYPSDNRFDAKNKQNESAKINEKKWKVTFKNGDSESMAKGIFQQSASGTVTGTFLTETGDYRFLEGVMDGNELKMSCFDGSHAYLFTGSVDGDKISGGKHYSGSTWSQQWTAEKDENFELGNPEELTYLKEGYDKVEFEFPNLKNEMVKFPEAFKGKVTIVQLMGSWCPNCMDETAYFVKLHKKYHDKGLEIVGLAFEGHNEFEKNAKDVQRVIDHYGIQYPVLIGGKITKESASKALPMLNKVMAFPTSIFIDKEGKVQKIHTGFSGPGTGAVFEDYKKKTEAFIESLL